MIWKLLCVSLALALVARLASTVPAPESPGPLQVTTLEVVDQRGRVRWRLEGENTSTHRPKLALLDERGKARVELTLGGGVEEPSLTFMDGVVGRPLLELELDAVTGHPELRMLSLKGQATCVDLRSVSVDAETDCGSLRLTRDDGLPVETK